MARFLNVLTVVAAVAVCMACAHDVPVGDRIHILTRSNLTLANTGDWFLVLYASWCPHCKSLMEILPDIAKEIKAENSAANIGCVDADSEPSIQMQFSMHGFPSLFMVHDGEVFEYPPRTKRNVEAVSKFILEDYAKQTPMTGIKAPFGIAMRAFALYSSFAIGAYRFFEVYAKMLNIPPMWFFCGIAGVLGIFIVLIMVLISRCRKPKKCAAPRQSKKKKEESAEVNAIVAQERTQNPTTIAGSETVKEKVESAKKDAELINRMDKAEQRARQQQQQAEQKSKKKQKQSKVSNQQNRPTQQPQKVKRS